MKTYWKWILGILIVLAVLGAVPFVMHFLINNGYITAPAMYAWHQGPTGPAFDKPFGFDGMYGPRGFDHHRSWNFHGRWFGFFGPFMFLGSLLKLTVFLGLLYGAYWLGRRNARLALDPATGSGQRPAPVLTPAPAPKRGGKASKKA